MPKFSRRRWALIGVIGTIGLFAGFPSHMDLIAIPTLQAGDAGARSSATATAKSSSASRTSGTPGGCHSETSSSAEVTTVIDGKEKTVRQEDADHSDECGARSGSEAKAVIDRAKAAADGTAGP
jgi:hypothetical protein